MILIRTYHWLGMQRDRLLGAVDHIQSESAKWRRTWSLLKGTFCLAMEHKQVAIGLILAGSVSGYVAADVIIDGYSFSRGDPGVYNAPSDAPVYYSSTDNTLRIDLGTTTVDEITIEDIDVGTAFAGSTLPVGETSAVFVGGLESAGTYIRAGIMNFTQSRCTRLTLTNSEVYKLIILDNQSDGQSIASTPDTPQDFRFEYGNRAGKMITSGGTYDQLKIQAPNTAVDGRVDVLNLVSLRTKGGPCTLDRLKVGTMLITLNLIGAGDGFAEKDFVVATSTVHNIRTTADNVEVSISPP